MLFFILLSTILFFFCLYFYFDNKKLKELINKLEIENKVILERKIINNKEDLVSIENISIDKNADSLEVKEVYLNNLNLEEKDQVESLSEKKLKEEYVARVNNDDDDKISNILKPFDSILTNLSLEANGRNQEINDSEQLESINLTDNNSQNISDIFMSLDFNPNEFIKTTKKDNYSGDEVNSYKNDKYLMDVARGLEEKIAPQTVDLTDYEKVQEENAIISYQELLSLKEHNEGQEKKDRTFLEELKLLRSLLDQNT